MLRVIEYFAKSLNVIRNGTIQQIACEFLSAFHSNAGPILYHFRDNARYWSKFGFRPPTFDTTVRESPSKYCDKVCCRKTRMVRLPSGEKKFENVFTGFDTIHERDRRQTDGQTPHDSIGRDYA